MTPPFPQCRGFTHPFILLVRNTLRTRGSLESLPRLTTSSPCTFLTTFSRQQRPFSLGRGLYNEKAHRPPATSTTKPTSKPPTIGFNQGHYLRQLAMKKGPTILYEGPRQTGFMISSHCATFFCFGSAVINSWFNVFNLPPGISSWVPVGFGVISFVFAMLGTIFALRPTGIIRSIKVLPFKTASKQAQTGTRAQEVLLEVAARRVAFVPLPLKRLQVDPAQIVMVNRMQYRPVILSREEMAARKLEEAERRKAQRQYELDHLLTAPFRDAHRVSSTVFSSIRRGLTGEGFAPIYINGIRYKLDVEGGYALENGQVLDRILKIQPDLELARIQSATPTKKI